MGSAVRHPVDSYFGFLSVINIHNYNLGHPWLKTHLVNCLQPAKGRGKNNPIISIVIT